MTYLLIDNEQRGPFDDAQINEMRLNGSIHDTCYAWREGLSDWVTLSILVPLQHPPPLPPKETRKVAWYSLERGINRGAFAIGYCILCAIAILAPPLIPKNSSGLLFMILIVISGLVLLTVLRLVNIGRSFLWSLLLLVPLLNVFVFAYCLGVPPDYARTKKIDIFTIILLGIGLLAIVGSVLSIILYKG